MRLGIVHRSALSRDMRDRLEKIEDYLEKLIKAAPSSVRLGRVAHANLSSGGGHEGKIPPASSGPPL